jgi:lipooligosaccharide transport system permease protein
MAAVEIPRSRRRSVLGPWRWPDVSWPRAWRMWQRNAVLFRRGWRLFVIPNFFEPVLYLLSIGLGLGLYIGQQIMGVDYVVFIAPGLAAASAMNGAVFEVTYNVYVKLQYIKLYDAVITTPLEPEDAAAGEIAWAVTRSLMYGVTFVIVMALLGYVRSPLALAAPLGLALIGVGFASLGMVVTAVIPRMELYTYFFTLFVTPMFLFSGIFYPIERLPDAAQPVAWFTPLHHGVELMRALCLTGDAAAAGGHTLWLLGFALLVFPPAVNLFRRRLIV